MQDKIITNLSQDQECHYNLDLLRLQSLTQKMQLPHPFIDTKLGRVTLLSASQPLPQGCRYLYPDECYWIKYELSKFAQDFVGFKSIALSSGLFRNWGNSVEIFDQTNNSECEHSFAILPNDVSVNIKHFDQITQLIKNNQFLFLPIGLVLKVSLKKPIPDGFRKMSIQQGYEYKEQLKKLLDTWSIVAFQSGKLDGSGYGYCFHDTYGSECGQVFIISVAPI